MKRLRHDTAAMCTPAAHTTRAMAEGTRLHELLAILQHPIVQTTIAKALRHCQGMGFELPLADIEIDALCKRLGDPS